MSRVIPAAMAAFSIAFFAYGVLSAPAPGPGGGAGQVAAVNGERISGDVDCSGGVSPVSAVDALKVLRYVAKLQNNLPDGCPPIGEGTPPVPGDVDCSDGASPVSAVDALKILRYVAKLTNNLPEGCPEIGSVIGGGSATPTGTASATPTPSPTPTPTASPTPTATATPTPSPTPSPTPTPPQQGPVCLNIDPPIPIPDAPDELTPGVLVYELPPQGTGTISDLDVCLNIVHTWPGDLVVTLRHEATGTTVALLNRVGVAEPNDPLGCEIDDVTVYLNDEATETIQDYCPPLALNGEFIPADALLAFDGKDMGGTWTLTVSDEGVGDAGSLTGFYLWFNTPQ